MKENRTTQKSKRFYEVFLRLLSHGKEIGRTCVQVQANTPFMAALYASKIMEGRYGQDILTSTIRVDSLTEDEFYYCTAA